MARNVLTIVFGLVMAVAMTGCTEHSTTMMRDIKVEAIYQRQVTYSVTFYDKAYIGEINLNKKDLRNIKEGDILSAKVKVYWEEEGGAGIKVAYAGTWDTIRVSQSEIKILIGRLELLPEHKDKKEDVVAPVAPTGVRVVTTTVKDWRE